MPPDVLQSLKKQCNPLLQKSFKERNPDVDMDEIQNNPNVPDDVKKAITGALSLTLEEDGGDTCDDEGDLPPPIDNVETFDDDYIMMSDDEATKKGRRKRLDENDEDWLTGRRKGTRPRKAKRKHKKRPKPQSENADFAKQTMDDNELKAKKKRVKKPNNVNNSMNVNLDTSGGGVPAGLANNSLNSTCNSTFDSTLSTSSSTNTSDLNGFNHMNSIFNATNVIGAMGTIDPMRKEIKPKKSPRKRDGTAKSLDGLARKTNRVQFSTISAIMACIEAVVQGNDVAISDVPVEQNVPFSTASEMNSEVFNSSVAETIDANVKVEPKQKPPRKPRVTKKETLQMPSPSLPPSPPLSSLPLANSVAVKTELSSKTEHTKKSRANGTSKSKTSMINKSNSLPK